MPFGLALTSGLVGGTAGVGLLAGGVVADHLSWRWLFVAGSGLVLIALGGILLTFAHARAWQVLTCYLVCSTGYGLAMAALTRLVNKTGDMAHSASANSINTVARTLGGAVGSQIGVAIVTSTTIPGAALPAPGGFTAAFATAAIIAALGTTLVPLARTPA